MTCFSCGVEVFGWEEEDDCVTEHYKHAPLCDFIIQKMTRDNGGVYKPKFRLLGSCLLGVDETDSV